jgi:hypothetical protein
MQTHEELHEGMFGIKKVQVPITNDTVLRSRCLACNPLNSGFSNVEGLIVEDADIATPIAKEVGIMIIGVCVEVIP